MKIVEATHGLTLIREENDKALSRESDVTHHMRRLLNKRDGGGWSRFWPDREGLTACRQGVRNKKTGGWYWHESYAVSCAHKDFNRGEVYYARA